MNESLRNRMMGSRNAQYRAMGVNTGLDPSLPGFDPSAGPLGPVTYDPLLGAPGMPRLSLPMTREEVTLYNQANAPRSEEGILQRVMRRMVGGPAPSAKPAVPSGPSPYLSIDDRMYNVPGVANGTPLGPQAAPVPVTQGSPPAAAPMSAPPIGGAMADARAQEIAYANSMMPQAGSMQAARAQEIAYANSQPNPAARRGGTGAMTTGQVYGPTMADMPKPALYMVDFGDGAPVRPYLSQDGTAPNIPGANVFKDDSYDPNAGALTKLIRGVF